jgi:hypothetical protein
MMAKPDPICHACGAKASAHPIPARLPDHWMTLAEFIVNLMDFHGSCVPGCQGCFK